MELSKYKEQFITLLEAGFIAVSQADEDAASKLFKAAALLDPSNTMPLIGEGYLHMHKLELQQAAAMFEKVLKKEPHNEMAKAFLGISLGLNPKETLHAEKVLEETIKESKDPEIKKLAHTTLDIVDTFVKKKPNPHEAHKIVRKRKSK